MVRPTLKNYGVHGIYELSFQTDKLSQGDVASEGAWIGISMSDRSDNLNNSSEGCTCS